MKIAVISAMEKELSPIINSLQGLIKKTYCKYDFYFGTIGENEVVFTTGGIGKTNTGVIMALVYSLFPDVELVINMGISGGVKGNVKCGDIVISRYLAYADVDVTALGYSFGQIPDDPRIFVSTDRFNDRLSFAVTGDILSGDTFFTSDEKVKEVSKKFNNFNVVAMDMESCSFAQCCYQFGIPFLAIRAISDIIGGNNQKESYEDYNKIACQKACEALAIILGV